MTKREKEFLKKEYKAAYGRWYDAHKRVEWAHVLEEASKMEQMLRQIVFNLVGMDMIEEVEEEVIREFKIREEKVMKAVDAEEEMINEMKQKVEAERETALEEWKRATAELKGVTKYGAISREYQINRVHYEESRDAFLELVAESDMEKIEEYFELGLEAIDNFAWEVERTLIDLREAIRGIWECRQWSRIEEQEVKEREKYQNALENLLDLLEKEDYAFILRKTLLETRAMKEDGTLVWWMNP